MNLEYTELRSNCTPKKERRFKALQKLSRRDNNAVYIEEAATKVHAYPYHYIIRVITKLGARKYIKQAERRKAAQFTTVMWAAALDNNALLPGCENGFAINACPLWLNMVNGCDHALKHYTRIDKCSGIEALGYTGAAGKTTIRSRGIDFRECQVQNLVGCSHESPIYPLSPGVMRQTREIVLP